MERSAALSVGSPDSARARDRFARGHGRTPPIGLALVLALAACGFDGAVWRDAVVVRDSSGVRIVESRAPAWREGQGWRIRSEPLLRIGRVDGAEADQLYRVRGAVRLSDGAVVVANAGTGQLRWYDANGVHLASAGAPGDGPGEFRSLSWIGRVADDSIYAWDRDLRRITVFHGGRLGRVATADVPLDRRLPTVVGALRDGSVVVTGGPTLVPEGDPGVQRPPLPVWLVSRDGARRATLGPFPDQAVNRRPAATPGAWITTAVPFGASTVVTAAGDRIVVGDNVAYELRLHAPDGSLAAVFRRPDAVPRPVRPEDLAAELEARLAPLPPIEAIRDGIRMTFEEPPAPGTMPHFRAVFADPDGNLWVQAYAPPQEPGTLWDVFDPEGRWLGGVEVPPGLEITEIGRDYVVGITRDALDVEYVQVHEVVKAGP